MSWQKQLHSRVVSRVWRPLFWPVQKLDYTGAPSLHTLCTPYDPGLKPTGALGSMHRKQWWERYPQRSARPPRAVRSRVYYQSRRPQGTFGQSRANPADPCGTRRYGRTNVHRGPGHRGRTTPRHDGRFRHYNPGRFCRGLYHPGSGVMARVGVRLMILLGGQHQAAVSLRCARVRIYTTACPV